MFSNVGTFFYWECFYVELNSVYHPLARKTDWCTLFFFSPELIMSELDHVSNSFFPKLVGECRIDTIKAALKIDGIRFCERWNGNMFRRITFSDKVDVATFLWTIYNILDKILYVGKTRSIIKKDTRPCSMTYVTFSERK